MRLRHNKKRNTAFLYETLIKELTKTIINEDAGTKQVLLDLIKEHFNKDTLLHQELQLYRTLCEVWNIPANAAEKLIFEIRHKYAALDKKELFNEQSRLIKKINKQLTKSVFLNFVPNYKTLATIYQIFNEETPTKDRVLLEENILKRLSSKKNRAFNEIEPVDNIVYKTFVEKFNSEYSSKLLDEQKELLSKYMSSFLDNGVEFKIFLNEEIERLKTSVSESLKMKEIKEDQSMLAKTKEVLNVLGSFREKKINKNLIEKVLKIQNLVEEIKN